jgi:hypothetical protein
MGEGRKDNRIKGTRGQKEVKNEGRMIVNEYE